jgi:hypothetical protein
VYLSEQSLGFLRLATLVEPLCLPDAQSKRQWFPLWQQELDVFVQVVDRRGNWHIRVVEEA